MWRLGFEQLFTKVSQIERVKNSRLSEKIHKYQKVFCQSHEMERKKSRNDVNALSSRAKTRRKTS